MSAAVSAASPMSARVPCRATQAHLLYHRAGVQMLVDWRGLLRRSLPSCRRRRGVGHRGVALATDSTCMGQRTTTPSAQPCQRWLQLLLCGPTGGNSGPLSIHNVHSLLDDQARMRLPATSTKLLFVPRTCFPGRGEDTFQCEHWLHCAQSVFTSPLLVPWA
jgi:hypothetical protein